MNNYQSIRCGKNWLSVNVTCLRKGTLFPKLKNGDLDGVSRYNFSVGSSWASALASVGFLLPSRAYGTKSTAGAKL